VPEQDSPEIRSLKVGGSDSIVMVVPERLVVDLASLLQQESLLLITDDVLALVLKDLKLPSVILKSLSNLTSHVLPPHTVKSYEVVLSG